VILSKEKLLVVSVRRFQFFLDLCQRQGFQCVLRVRFRFDNGRAFDRGLDCGF
jgi:hypothetical protein